MQRGVYKPVRTYFSPAAAIACTFVASGLFHELLLSNIYCIHDNDLDEDGNCDMCYFPTYGRQSLFFTWFGILINVENFIVNRCPKIHNIFRKLPRLFVNASVVMLGLPVAHWFVGDMVAAKYLHHCQLSIPTFVLMNKIA